MNKKLITAIGILFLILASGLLGYWLSVFGKIEKTDVTKEYVKDPEPVVSVQTSGKDIFVPEGWVSYTDNDFKITFSYPKQWEMFKNERSLAVKGEGYSIAFSNVGGDLEQKDWTHPLYYVGGYEVPGSWEFFDGERYQQILSLSVSRGLPSVIIKVTTSNNSKVLSDRIISSVIFLK